MSAGKVSLSWGTADAGLCPSACDSHFCVFPLSAPKSRQRLSSFTRTWFIPGKKSGSARAAFMGAEGSTSPGSRGHTQPCVLFWHCFHLSGPPKFSRHFQLKNKPALPAGPLEPLVWRRLHLPEPFVPQKGRMEMEEVGQPAEHSQHLSMLSLKATVPVTRTEEQEGTAGFLKI